MLLKKLILLIMTVILLIVSAEIFLRVYYATFDLTLAVNRNEYCLKENFKRLPTDKDWRFFVNFQRLGWLDDDPVIGITLKKNVSQSDIVSNITIAGESAKIVIYGEHHTNNQRMSAIKDFSYKKPEDVTKRIVLLGDSFTCGNDVPHFFGMGQLLQEFVPKSEVLNFCIGGTGIDTMYARYVLEAQNFSHDIVIMNILVDDLQRPFACEFRAPNVTVENGKVVIGPRRYPTPQALYENYTLPRHESYFVKSIISLYNAQTVYRRDMEKGFKLLGSILDELKQKTKENNATFFVGLIIENDPNHISIEYYEKLKLLLKEKQIPYFDSVKYFQENKNLYGNQEIYYWAENATIAGHYNPVGYALYAQGLKNILEKHNLINTTPNYAFYNTDRMKEMTLTSTSQEAKKRIISPYRIVFHN